MRRILIVALVCSSFGAISSRAQAPDPVIEHFNASSEAMERGDLDAAASSAQAAFEASQSRDGEGGSTAVLAFNLASLRLMLEQYDEALAPAQLAQRAADAGNAGVDGLRARIAVARAELGATTREGGDASLQALITEASSRPEISGDVHHAAIQLAKWRFAQAQYAQAREAWAIASSTARGSMFGVNHGRGVALVGQAVATMYEEADRPPYRISAEKRAEIEATLDEGMRTLWRLADRARNPAQMGPDESAYAEAMASRLVWRFYLQDRARRDNDTLADTDVAYPTGYWQAGLGGEASLPECQIRISARPPPLLPTETDHIDAGAAVIWLRFDAAGEVVERRVAGIAGGNARFARSIRDLASRWRVEFEGPRPPACRLPTSTYRSVVFRFRE